MFNTSPVNEAAINATLFEIHDISVGVSAAFSAEVIGQYINKAVTDLPITASISPTANLFIPVASGYAVSSNAQHNATVILHTTSTYPIITDSEFVAMYVNAASGFKALVFSSEFLSQKEKHGSVIYDMPTDISLAAHIVKEGGLVSNIEFSQDVSSSLTRLSIIIKEYNEALYNSLTDKEWYTYENTAEGYPFYAPYFTNLSDAMVDWIQDDRNERVKDIIMALYGYIAFHHLYGSDYTRINDANSNNIVNMGIEDRVIADPIDYYATGDDSNIAADIALVAATIGVEIDDINELVTYYQQIVSDESTSIIFEDVNGGTALTKEQIGQIIFEDLDWKRVVRTTNVGNIQVPSYID